MKKLLILAASALALTAAEPGKPWNHNPADAKLGPGNWGNIEPAYGACSTGTRQSPVDIDTKAVVPGTRNPLVFNYKARSNETINNGHVLEVSFPPGSTLQTGPGPNDTYELKQYHVHAPSEHSVNGKLADAEIHLVHQNKAGNYAVVGLFVDKVSAPASVYFSRAITKFPPKVATLPYDQPAPELSDILPSDRTYYRYDGSLTTPGCTEAVTFFIMKNPISVAAQSTVLPTIAPKIAAFPYYNGYDKNNRPVQKLNNRKIQVVQP